LNNLLTTKEEDSPEKELLEEKPAEPLLEEKPKKFKKSRSTANLSRNINLTKCYT
jgi:hypothetical protein